jgi:hypothetical protein
MESCREGPVIRAATTCLAKSQVLPLFALLLVLAGCSTLSRNTVLIRGSVDARLVTRVKAGLFLTTVRIGEREAGPFLIDTGSQSLYLDSELARSLNPSFWGEGDNPQVKQKVKWGTLDSLEVGPMTLQHTDVAVMDLSTPSTPLGERLAGILGHPFFAQAIVEVDYPAGSIACFDPKTYRLPQGEWLPLTFEAGRPIIPARIEGNIDGQFILDTGSNFAVLFYPDFVQKHGLLDKLEGLTTSIDGFTLAGGAQDAPWRLRASMGSRRETFRAR